MRTFTIDSDGIEVLPRLLRCLALSAKNCIQVSCPTASWERTTAGDSVVPIDGPDSEGLCEELETLAREH